MRTTHDKAGSWYRQPLWRLAIEVAPEAEAAVTELMGEMLGQPVCSYTDLEAGVTTVMSFLNSRNVWSQTTRVAIRTGLQSIEACGLSVGSAKLSFCKLKSQDWSQAWKHHFKPFHIGSALLVRPSWSRIRPKPGQLALMIDPGLTFGTGHHPTTRFCLEQLVNHRGTARSQSFLDLGSGSGILAIAAAKLGYAPVLAIDFDPDAVRIARDNARRNRLAGKVEFRRLDITKLRLNSAEKYSVVCANLITPLLLSERKRILTRVEKEGVLVLAGILESEFESVRAAYASQGLRPERTRTEREWRSGVFRNQMI